MYYSLYRGTRFANRSLGSEVQLVPSNIHILKWIYKDESSDKQQIGQKATDKSKKGRTKIKTDRKKRTKRKNVGLKAK